MVANSPINPDDRYMHIFLLCCLVYVSRRVGIYTHMYVQVWSNASSSTKILYSLVIIIYIPQSTRTICEVYH